MSDDDGDERKERAVEERDEGEEENIYRGYGHVHLNVYPKVGFYTGRFIPLLPGGYKKQKKARITVTVTHTQNTHTHTHTHTNTHSECACDC